MSFTLESAHQVLGVLGAVTYVLAYVGLQLGLWQGTQLRYIVLNILAASFVLISLMSHFNLASVIIQITWLAVSFFGIARGYYLRSVTRFSPEELVFYQDKLSAMGKPMARRFFNSGQWLDAEDGAVIAEEGVPIGALCFVAQGQAQAHIQGAPISDPMTQCFIGEMTCFDGGPASASVHMVSAGRLFRIATPALQKLVKKDPELKVVLDGVLGLEMRLKLIASNERMVAKRA